MRQSAASHVLNEFKYSKIRDVHCKCCVTSLMQSHTFNTSDWLILAMQLEWAVGNRMELLAAEQIFRKFFKSNKRKRFSNKNKWAQNKTPHTIEYFPLRTPQEVLNSWTLDPKPKGGLLASLCGTSGYGGDDFSCRSFENFVLCTFSLHRKAEKLRREFGKWIWATSSTESPHHSLSLSKWVVARVLKHLNGKVETSAGGAASVALLALIYQSLRFPNCFWWRWTRMFWSSRHLHQHYSSSYFQGSETKKAHKGPFAYPWGRRVGGRDHRWGSRAWQSRIPSPCPTSSRRSAVSALYFKRDSKGAKISSALTFFVFVTWSKPMNTSRPSARRHPSTHSHLQPQKHKPSQN